MDLNDFLKVAKEYGPELLSGAAGAYSAYKGTEDNVQKPYYLPGQEEALTDAMKSAQDLYAQGPLQYYPGQTVAGLDQNVIDGQNAQLANMDRMGQIGDAGAQAALQLAQGGADQVGGFQLQDQIGFGIPKEYQDAIMNPIMNRLNEQVIPGIHTASTSQGAFGGSRMQQQKADAATQATEAATNAMIQGNLQARGQSIGQRTADHNAQLTGRGQDIQQNALYNQALANSVTAGNNAMIGLRAPGAMQQEIGASRTEYDQKLIDADKARFDFEQAAPGTALDALTARLQGLTPPSGYVQPGQSGDWTDAIAGFFGGTNIWNQMGAKGE